MANIDTIRDYLGANYSIKIIDQERVIYRRLKNDYDFEVSGLDNNKKNLNVQVYVWDIRDKLNTVEDIKGITSKESLNETLNNLTQKYLCMRD